VLEPLLLALMVSFSLPGFYLSLAALFAFFAHQPIRIWFSRDRHKHGWAVFFLTLYAPFILFFTYLFYSYANPDALWLFGSAVGIMFLYLILDLLRLGRRLFVEIMAPASIGLIAAAIVRVNGWSLEASLALWIVILARAVPTAFYIHSRLKILKGQPAIKKTTLTINILFWLITV